MPMIEMDRDVVSTSVVENIGVGSLCYGCHY